MTASTGSEARPTGWRAQLGRRLIKVGQALASEAAVAPEASLPSTQAQPEPAAEVAPDKPPADDQIRQPFYAALEAQTPDNLIEFVEFCNRFRRHSVFNARLIETQRRGARACATAAEWRRAGRWVLPDAQPIIILWPFGPTAHVYDV